MPKKAPVFDVSAAKIEEVVPSQTIVAEDESKVPGEVTSTSRRDPGPFVMPAAVPVAPGN
jgi:hypothetical protein